MVSMRVRKLEVSATHEPWGKSGKRKAESGNTRIVLVLVLDFWGRLRNEGFKVPMRVQKQMETLHEQTLR